MVSEEGDSQPKTDPFAALRYKDFRSYIGMRFSSFAYQMQAVIIVAFTYIKLKAWPGAGGFIILQIVDLPT